jgi:hypothetical protein
MNYKVAIGIDTGTKTGFAVWHKDEKKFLEIVTLKIHEAMDRVKLYHDQYGDGLFVRFEDARLRTWFGQKSIEALQGAGSIKRDCSIWDDFLKDCGINYASFAPKRGLTKLEEPKFKLITKWEARTSNHGRDAAMLVFGM